jgi:hypothetical protein
MLGGGYSVNCTLFVIPTEVEESLSISDRGL